MTLVRIAAIAALTFCLSFNAEARTISLKTADSATISADHRGSGDHGIVLVHALGGDRSGWAKISEILGENDLQVVSIDLRGHGGSKGEPDTEKMVEDVLAAAKYLRSKGVTHITLAGAKLGGNLAFAATAKDKEIKSCVMISPALNASGVKVSSSLKGFGDRKLLLIAGDDDNLSKKAVNLIANEVPNTTVRILETGGSGMALVNRASDMETTLLAWAAEKKSAEGDLTPDVKTGGADNLETTGTKLGEK